MPTPQDKLYFTVRKTDNKEWIDVNSWGYLLQTAQYKAKKTDQEIPSWSKDNKVVRYAQFKLTEI